MTTYSTSCGERLKKSVIDRLVKKAKAAKLHQQHNEFGHNFCEHIKEDGSMCRRSGGVRLDCSHTVSVKEAQESGCAELAFDVDNIKIRCRTCHQKLDGLDLQSGKIQPIDAQNDESEFIQYCKDEREAFIQVVNAQPWNNGLRTACENMIIAFNQLLDKQTVKS